MKAASTTDRQDLIAYPTNRVVGTVGDAAKAKAAIDALLRAGFDRQEIDMLHDEEDLKRLDRPAEHGFLKQFQRTLLRTFDFEEFRHLKHHVDDVRAGRYVIMVLTKRRGLRTVAADILHQHGAEFVGFYGRWAWEELPSTAQTRPEDIPALFARAWNDRDAAALASLFDTDAEFVAGDGLWWHDRDSIRKAHSQLLARAVTRATLAAAETKVKLLSPEVAVVYAKLTLSDPEPAGAPAPPGGRTTIASFVVHRAGERWMCASAHSADILPTARTPVVGEAGVMGMANYSGDQVS